MGGGGWRQGWLVWLGCRKLQLHCKKWIVILTKLSCETPLIIPCLRVQCSRKLITKQFGMWEMQWVHCVLNDAEYADRKA